VIAQVLSLYAEGACIEDQAELQRDEGTLRMLGASRIPNPTTASALREARGIACVRSRSVSLPDAPLSVI
jgi:hypothetical protein